MKKLQFMIIRLVVLSALFVTGAFGNTVSFDTSFNGTGYSTNPAVPLPASSNGRTMIMQMDGKILIAGDTVVNSQLDKFAVMRLNADGTLDTSFGSNGSVVTVAGTDAQARKLLLQPDGKILLCGASYTEGSGYNFTLIRYTSAGVLDTTFNSTGFVMQNITGDYWDFGDDLALQADGKIIVVGSSALNIIQPQDIVVVRFNQNGSLDSTFNSTGILTVGTPTVSEAAHSVMIEADGKILIGGFRHNGVKDNFLLMRFNSNGTVDASFGTGGTTITSAGSGSNQIYSMARQSSGKIVVGGSGSLARYTADGILDPTFGTGGVTNVQAAYETGEIAVAGDDKILVASRGVFRFTANGFRDTNFNGGHSAMWISGQADCSTASVAIQPDAKIVLGGSCAYYLNNTSIFAVFRFQETRTKQRILDFNGNGGTDMSIYRPSNGQWWYLDSGNLFSQIVVGTFGTATDRPVPADFTGDGRTDVAVFRPSTGEWFVLRSEDGSFYSFPFGTSGDIPIAADYDGDDKADAGIFRPSTGEWYIQKTTGGLFYTAFGTTGDKPVPSDYDGDFKTDIAIFRPSSGEWWIQKSIDASIYAFQFGTSTDKLAQGDYTGDNKTDAAFWRPSTGEWFVLRSEDNSYYSIPFGLSDDLPTPGNYVGDDRYDFVIFRPSTNEWHVQWTGSNVYFKRTFGTAGDQPLPNLFVP